MITTTTAPNKQQGASIKYYYDGKKKTAKVLAKNVQVKAGYKLVLTPHNGPL